ncbi:MAG TPA: hypothetical protein VNO54_06685 [Streptosporangiaceae bacterium]|nr:hypothetical protein [Streptosporangiaceae bacterium]
MSTTRHHSPGLTVSTYAGPARTDGDRRCVQIASRGQVVGLTAEAWEALAGFVCGLDRDMVSIFNAPEVPD